MNGIRALLGALRGAMLEFLTPLGNAIVALVVLALGVLIYAVVLYSAVRMVHGD